MGATLARYYGKWKQQEPNEDKTIFDVLPVDLLYALSDYLRIEELRNVAKISAAWRLLLSQTKFWKRRYALKEDGATAAAASLSERFFDGSPIVDGLLNPIKVMAVDMEVTWLDGRYLCKELDSTAGHEVLRLKTVCFLHIMAAFEIVVPGTYCVWCRMKVKEPSVYGTTRVQVRDGENVPLGECRLTYEHFTDAAMMFGEDWFYLRIENVKVRRADRVSFLFHSEDGYIWKGGLWWDFVEMTRRPHPERLGQVYDPVERASHIPPPQHQVRPWLDDEGPWRLDEEEFYDDDDDDDSD